MGHKSAKVMKRAKAIEQRQLAAADGKSKLLKNMENADSLKLMALEHHKQQLVRLDNVSLYYGYKKACENVSFTIEQGTGLPCAGKTVR